MNREHAIALMAIYQRIGIALNEATELISTEPVLGEQKRLRLPLGKLMADLFTELQLPIIREHPDLDPDRQS